MKKYIFYQDECKKTNPSKHQPMIIQLKCRSLIITISLLVNFIQPYSLQAVTKVFIKNHTKQEYNAASQNWSCAQDSKRIMYSANNVGLLEYDGNSWLLNPAPEGSNLRTVAVDFHNRVYTAGYRELGYWERNQYGILEYHSLKKEIEHEFTDNEEFWTVLVTPGAIYFHSFSMIVIYEQQKFHTIKNQGFITSISNGGDGIYVSIMNRGIFRIDNHKLIPFIQSELIEKTQVQFILPLDNGNKLIGTANNGIFISNGKHLDIWKPELNDSFIKNIVNKGVVMRNGKIVIGTILDGLSVYSPLGELDCKISKDNGLQNNTVLGIFTDVDQNIWLSLDRGIDFVSLTADPSYTIYEHNELGAVYSGAFYQNKLYLATNKGLYQCTDPLGNHPFLLVPGTQGHAWDCKIINNKLFVNHNSGAFEIKDNKATKISSASGGFSITQNPMRENSLVQSTYSNIVFFGEKSNHWAIDHIDFGFNDLIRFLEIDHVGNFWASHMYRGVYRLRYNDNDSLVYKRYFSKETFGKDHHIHVFKMENRIVFTTGEKLYTFDDLRDTIVDYIRANRELGKYAATTRIVPAGNHHYWLITRNECGLFQIENNTAKKIKEFPFTLFQNQLITDYENIIIDPNLPNRAILCLENGFALLETDSAAHLRSIADKVPILTRMSSSGRNEMDNYMPLDGQKLTLPYHLNNLKLQFAFPIYGRESVSYQFLVEGLDHDWSEPRMKPLININRIPTGKYKIHAKAINSWGQNSSAYTLNLEIRPPWYQSSVAYALYLALLAALLILYRHWIVTRTQLKERREMELKERELMTLRNEKLQYDLSYKVKELASSTMHIIKKNEFLIEIKEILSHQKSVLGTRYPDKYFETLTNKIDGNMTSQDNWKIFEANFEQTYEQFMKKLRENYPDLTPSDLRLCALLRMNLSSKEIAPLLGVSVRGIENHRYRIRKRLNLENDQNLTDFILGL